MILRLFSINRKVTISNQRDKFYLFLTICIIASIIGMLVMIFVMHSTGAVPLNRFIPLGTCSSCTREYMNTLGAFEISVKLISCLLSVATATSIFYSTQKTRKTLENAKTQRQISKIERWFETLADSCSLIFNFLFLEPWKSSNFPFSSLS